MRRSMMGGVLVYVLLGGTFVLTASGASAQTGAFQATTIGSASGTARYEQADQTYALAAQGSALQGESDDLSLTWQPLDGDGMVMARISLEEGGGEAGVMIRESEAPNAPLAAVLANDKAVVFARRLAVGQGIRRASSAAFKAPISVRLIRSGSQFSAWISQAADPSTANDWKRLGEPQTVEMKPKVLIGLFAAGQSPSVTARLSKASVTTSTPAVAMPKGLIHHYRFGDGGVRDEVGTAHGQLVGRAQASGGKLTLDNVGRKCNDPSVSYAQFPPSVLPNSGSVSIELWFTARTTEMWTRVLDIGTQQGGFGDHYLFLTPRGEWDMARLAYSLGGPGRETRITAGAPLDDGKLHMVAIVIDGNSGMLSLYVDGRPAGTPANVGRGALAMLAPAKVFLGRSMFDSDPAYSGTIEDFRIYQTPLTADEVAEHYRSPSR